MVNLLPALAVSLGLASHALAQATISQGRCDNIQSSIEAIANLHVNFVEFVPNGTNLTFPGNVRGSFSRMNRNSS